MIMIICRTNTHCLLHFSW